MQVEVLVVMILKHQCQVVLAAVVITNLVIVMLDLVQVVVAEELKQ